MGRPLLDHSEIEGSKTLSTQLASSCLHYSAASAHLGSRCRGRPSKVRRMKYLDEIEQRIALPGDSETRRSQKRMLVVVALFGSVLTLFNAMPMFNGGLEAMGWTYMGSAVCLLAGALAILAWPQRFTLFTFLILIDVLFFPAISQVLSGGYASGMFFMAWAIVAPLGAVLVLGTAHTVAQFALFGLTVVLVAALEPFSQSIAPDITSSVRLGYNIPGLLSLGLIVTAASLYLLRQVERLRLRADVLLLNTLPASIAERLKAGAKTIADGFDSISVLFADVVGFTTLSEQLTPRETLDLLNEIFTYFDGLTEKYGVEKIRTIGDGYMVAAGAPLAREDHAQLLASMALEMQGFMRRRESISEVLLQLRIGINSGTAVGGIVGTTKFHYDVWGDMVNTASRLESQGLPGKILIARPTYELIKDDFICEPLGKMHFKGKGEMDVWAVSGVQSRRGH